MKISQIAEFVKLEHTVFDLPFVVSGAILASGGHFFPFKYLLILITVTSARATAMSVNRIEGLRFDKKNPRKKDWLLVSGKMTVKEGVTMALVFGLVFEISAYFLNTFVLILSPVVLVLFVLDPFVKRFTPWRHLSMGATIGVGVLGGYLAIDPRFPSSLPVYLIVLASSFWIAGFDMIYTIPDVEVDKAMALHTVMSDYGVRRGLVISSLFHMVTVASFVALLIYIKSIFYLFALVPITLLIVYQHLVIDLRDPDSIRVSFQNSNTFLGVIFLIGLVLAQIYPSV